DDDLVSLLEKSSPITLRNQVYRLRSAANEDNFPFAPGVNKALDFLARRFIGCGRPFAQIVDAPMNIRILRAVVAIQCVDDTLRLLAGSAVVEVHQGLAVNLLLQNRKIRTDFADIQRFYQSARRGDFVSDFHG